MEDKKKSQSIYDLIREYLKEAEELRRGFPSMERPSWDLRACTLEPLSNIFVATREVIITADLPFVQSNSVMVEPISNDRLEITAEMKRKFTSKDLGMAHHRGEFSTFSCQTRIPVPVDLKHMQTSFRRGVLEIRMPRKRVYKIPVK
ncbi:MAG TPA: Hsp20/alpha crystallin family protein [Candidatus Bathyarchaeia archaeon]|nr:Hsp20/alpha crystallin family protein [Candidatus Bathyarchaeia archaeon]